MSETIFMPDCGCCGPGIPSGFCLGGVDAYVSPVRVTCVEDTVGDLFGLPNHLVGASRVYGTVPGIPGQDNCGEAQIVRVEFQLYREGEGAEGHTGLGTATLYCCDGCTKPGLLIGIYRTIGPVFGSYYRFDCSSTRTIFAQSASPFLSDFRLEAYTSTNEPTGKFLRLVFTEP
jgi:hypothetical protein